MLKEILQRHGFTYNRALGQNFIGDPGLLASIVRDSGVTAEDTVVEIGAGAGTLTKELCAAAKRVYAFEVDARLQPVLDETLRGSGNASLHFADVLRLKDAELEEIIPQPFLVVANLPYYITTPLIMRFIESRLNVRSITVMVQKEVAERLCALPDTPEYGAITVAVRLWGDAEITRVVDKRAFYPVPKVDSAVVRITGNRKCEADAALTRLIRAAFNMRRKTLVNNIAAAFALDKSDAESAVKAAGFDARVRGESLSLDDFIEISRRL